MGERMARVVRKVIGDIVEGFCCGCENRWWLKYSYLKRMDDNLIVQIL